MSEDPRKSRSAVWSRRGSVALLLSGAAAAAFPSASGCKGKEDELECDAHVIFEQSCDGASCHGSETPRANLDLVSAGVDQRLFHVLGTSDCDERKLVFPGQPDESLLYIKVAESDPFCGGRMPVGEKLSKDEISCIRRYIEEAGTTTDVADCETCGSILCVDFDRDPAHCGGCDQACEDGQICGDGQCINPCQAGETLCGASCVTIDSNNSHCGTCGHRCGPGSSCDQGVCQCDPTSNGAGGGGGDTGMSSGDVSFQSDILPIFENACAESDCHADMGDAPLSLDAATAHMNLVGIDAEECSGKQYVVPGSPDQSYLVDKLMGGSICAGEQMPMDEEPLPNAGIRSVIDWICEGAPND